MKTSDSMASSDLLQVDPVKFKLVLARQWARDYNTQLILFANTETHSFAIYVIWIIILSRNYFNWH